jgi:hypothetical protein
MFTHDLVKINGDQMVVASVSKIRGSRSHRAGSRLASWYIHALYLNFASLDISNLYTNIPINETQTIFANILEQNLVHPQTQEELMKCYETITKQNYFSYKHNILTQKESLAMGAP